MKIREQNFTLRALILQTLRHMSMYSVLQHLNFAGPKEREEKAMGRRQTFV